MMRIYIYLTFFAALLFTAGLNAQDIIQPVSGTQNFTVASGSTTMYYDDGGENCDDETPDGSYANNADGTAVICPDQPNQFVQISFLEVDIETRFSTNPCWDVISIYDGEGTSNLIFSGCGEEGFQNCPGFPGDGDDPLNTEGSASDMHGLNDPQPQNAVFTSSDPGGCLTVNFDSDGSVDEGGWVAEVTTIGGVASCTDGIQNGNETGVDCGGSCPPCDNGGGDDDDDDDNGTCTDVTVSITLDDFPGETSWQITNDAGAVVASGGTYGSEPDGSTVTETVCLDDGCYDFTIFDAFGDGICCTYGPGSYTVSDDEGAVFASGGEFDDEETTTFCLGDCVPAATFEEASYCASGRFYIRVDLTSLGSGSAVDITTNVGGREYFGVDRLRTYALGMFDAGTDVVVSVTNVDDPDCVLTSATFDGSCNSNLVIQTPQNGHLASGQAEIFPNPTNGELNVSLSNYQGQAVEIVINDAVGRLVATRRIDQVDSAVESFDLSNQQTGLYMMTIRAQDSGEQLTKRFIVNN